MNDTTAPGPSLGQIRVRAAFNVNNDSLVERLKQSFARQIDDLEALKADAATKHADLSPEEYREKTSHLMREIATAQTEIEKACMFAVKAATNDVLR
jgi:hypothetical protein